ncbi:competence protein ComK [Jeotgalibacillus sp. R-1-5s-1]|uniref:Rok-like winged helix domain-containing protein n=1 Tax=Jeotgalibacillus sp. R-1-5s-1 TaxID=2555897 RepID=UPI00106B4401|nr:competence protein ComK [Jeotgalibacillus sp. R-1-5s-1]TFE03323.1 competence protein ComK [Jeotgalibacillus sp. R-1-5s-1]
MFDERTALKIRLEQMIDSEERILNEFRKEREAILTRLRELDKEEGLAVSSQMTTEENHPMPATEKPRKVKDIGKSKRMHEAAFTILKSTLEPIKGTDIQDFIEKETGYKVANITTFMKTIQKKDANVRKLDRGLYIYEPQN